MADKIKVGLLTHAGGAHVVAYLNALAATEACAEVVLADPDGKWEEDAKNILGNKLARVSRDYDELLARERPEMALVTMEAKLAPPVINAAWTTTVTCTRKNRPASARRILCPWSRKPTAGIVT